MDSRGGMGTPLDLFSIVSYERVLALSRSCSPFPSLMTWKGFDVPEASIWARANLKNIYS